MAGKIRRPEPSVPRDKPRFIDPPVCDTCGSELVLGAPGLLGEVWYDEWECSAGCDGVYMDWPPEYFDEVVGD